MCLLLCGAGFSIQPMLTMFLGKGCVGATPEPGAACLERYPLPVLLLMPSFTLTCLFGAGCPEEQTLNPGAAHHGLTCFLLCWAGRFGAHSEPSAAGLPAHSLQQRCCRRRKPLPALQEACVAEHQGVGRCRSALLFSLPSCLLALFFHHGTKRIVLILHRYASWC